MFHNAINTPDRVKILRLKEGENYDIRICYEMDNRKRFSSLHAIIAALREGSIEAFDTLYNQFVGKVHNFIKKNLRRQHHRGRHHPGSLHQAVEAKGRTGS